MNTEKLEKLKKSLDNKFVPDSMKDKIRAEIEKLESEIKAKEVTPTEIKEEIKNIEVKVDDALENAEKKEEKQEESKPKTTKKATSGTKKTAMALAKEIRKEGESWTDAVSRASKQMKGVKEEVKKETKSEINKLKSLIRKRKDLQGVSSTNLMRDGHRKALPSGKRTSATGHTYYENRRNRTDKGKVGSLYLAKGGAIPNNYEGKTPEQVWNSWTEKQREHFLADHYDVLNDKNDLNSKNKSFQDLDFGTQNQLSLHIEQGQYADGGFMGGVYKEGGEIPFRHCNLTIVGTGIDVNGNRIVKVAFPNQRAFSIQTNGKLPYTHRLLRNFNTQEVDLDNIEIQKMEDEIIDYVENYGSDKQKKSLRVYGSWLDKNNYAGGGALYSPYTNNPLKYLNLMGAKPNSDLNYSTEHNGIDYYVGRKKDKYGDNIAIVVAFIDDENNYIIHSEDAKEMSETAREKGVDKVELYTNYGVELHTTQKPQILGFDKIVKVTSQLSDGGDFMSGAYAEDGAEVTYMRNKDGIRVKSVAMPEKELTEAEWLAKRNESREARSYAVGGGIFADTFTGTTETHYTGLVGETNAMSSGEMFADGGAIANQQLIADAHLRPAEMFGAEGIPAYNEGGNINTNENKMKKRLEKGDDVLIIGRRWFDRVNGNTYHTAEVQVNGEFVGKSRMTYGYYDQYLETGKEILLQHYELPEGMSDRDALWHLREHGVILHKYAIDGLKRELAHGGGVTTHNGREYSTGRNWTNDHNHTNKAEEHEVSYKRKKSWFNNGGLMDIDNGAGYMNDVYAGGGKVSPFKNMMETNTITEKEINLIKLRMNNGKVDEQTQEAIDYIWDNSPRLTPDQDKKGIDYLKNLWKSPTGKERANNPFGYREQDTLETFEYFELRGFYDAGNYHHKFYVPLYTCVGKDSTFEYYVSGGSINIVG